MPGIPQESGLSAIFTANKACSVRMCKYYDYAKGANECPNTPYKI